MSTILTSLHGRQVGLDNHQRVCAPRGFRSGPPGVQTDLESPYTRSLFDGFEGIPAPVDPRKWAAFAGTTATSFAQTDRYAGAEGTVGTVNTFASSGITLYSGGRWFPSDGELTLQARIMCPFVNELAGFVGFAVGSTAATALPIAPTGVGNGVTANDTNSVGFVFGANMAQPVLYCVSANGANVQILPTTHIPQPGVDIDLRVEVSALGAARFYVDGDVAGDFLLEGAVNPTAQITPLGSAMLVGASTQTNTVVMRYVSVSCLR